MKYFFFDIDGTLATSVPDSTQYVPESTKLAIQKLKDAGHFVAIATGRSYAMAKKYLKELDFDNMVSDGGNGITINGKLIGIEPLDYEFALAVIDECIKKGYPWGFSPDNEMRRLCPDNTFYEFTHDEYMACETVKNLNPRDYNQIYKVYVACFYPDEFKLESIKKVPWCRYHKEYFFCEPTDKSKGIKKIVDYFHGNYKDVVVFGDGKNDLSMFTDEWLCIAMGNACDELKEKADYITTDVEDNGIYNACKHFNWID